MSSNFYNQFLDILTYIGEHIDKNILIRCTNLLIEKKKETYANNTSKSEDKMAETTRECIKISNLRKKYGSDITFEKWLQNSNNFYCGRSGRIFITENGIKKYFGYEASKWANPYTVKQYSIDECLDLYKKYINEKIQNNSAYDLNELKGKNLGCWCIPNNKCHVDVLLDLLEDV